MSADNVTPAQLREDAAHLRDVAQNAVMLTAEQIAQARSIGATFTRKIVEIAAGTPPFSGLFALCNDGTLWELIAGNQMWRRCADIPEDADTEWAAADALREEAGT